MRGRGGYLLDTNIVSDLLRHPDGRVARRIAEIGPQQICTSIVVAGELRFGAAKRGSARLTNLVEGVLDRLPVLPLGPPADIAYARLRARLERDGAPIGAHDMLIAAHALAENRTLVTANQREFARVAGLRFENWAEEGELGGVREDR